MSGTRLRWTIAVLVLALVAAACGSGRKSSSGATTTSTAVSTAKTFGDLPSPCGPGDAKGATDQGVTDTSITIGYGDDRGFSQQPGLLHQMGDATRAMIKWCNDQGGINGRQIIGKFYDSKVVEANNVMTDACKSVFMLVGEGQALDVASEQTRVGCNLVAVEGFSVSSQFAMGPIQYQGVPNPADYSPGSPFAEMAKLFPNAIKHAVLYDTTLPTQHTSEVKAADTAERFGWTWLRNCTQTTNYQGEPDYKPFAKKMKDCGAQIVFDNAVPGPLIFNYFQAASQVGFDPIYLWEASGYVPEFAAWNTAGLGNKVYARLAFIPLEEASTVKAVRDYLDIVKGAGINDTDQLGEQSASSFLLWATEAKACASDLTRQCMINHLSKVTKWTGGGLHAETNPGQNLPPKCGLLVKLEGTKWVRAYPPTPGTYDCNDSYLVKNSPSVVDVPLDANREFTKYVSASTLKPQP